MCKQNLLRCERILPSAKKKLVYKKPFKVAVLSVVLLYLQYV
jgi:hypothetical protein